MLEFHDMDEAIRQSADKIHLSCNVLKLIACISMLIDHIGYGIIKYYIRVQSTYILPETYKTFDTAYDICHGIGRLAFPIFAFFLVEGFMRTKSVVKYALRLLIFGLISEIPFDLGLFKNVFYKDHQNILLTFFISLVMLAVLRYLDNNPAGLSKPVIILAYICTIIAFSDVAVVLNTDYSWKCTVLVALLYITRSIKPLQLISGAAATSWEAYAPASFLLLWFYDPQIKPRFKYAFYAFYPLHLVLIYFVAKILIG